MRPDDIRNLLGGYATGTLTPEERELLFAAALEDQALFDALADEEQLREILSNPETRRRLLRLLQPSKPSLPEQIRAWFGRPAIWATAGVAVVALVLTVSVRPPTPPPVAVEMAKAVPASSPAPLRDQAKPDDAKPAEARRESAPKATAPAPSKMKVAVLEFDSGPAQAKEAQAASDLMEKKLDSSGYAVIDRKRVDEALQAQNLNNRQLDKEAAAGVGRSLGADAVIVGSVKPAAPPVPSPAPPSFRAPAAGLTRLRSKVAATEQVAVTATAIDTQSAASLAYAQGGQIDQVAASLTQQIQVQQAKARTPLEGLVTDVNAKILTLNIGSKAGVKPGDRFELRRAGKPLGKIVVNSTQDTFSVGTYDGADPAKSGDTVNTE